jgi:uncharacterized membrane protein YfcA
MVIQPQQSEMLGDAAKFRSSGAVWLSIAGFILIGLAGGAILASTGVIGPFLVPALLLLGIPSDVTRGTVLLSELLITVACIIGHKKVGNFDRRVILAFLPGAFTVFLGANMSVRLPESFMKVTIGLFEMVIGAMLICATLSWAGEQHSKTSVDSVTIMAKLMFVAVLAGFAKGFFGAGWGPLGIGMFILLGIDPHVVVGSSLVIRLLLDAVGGMTYATMNLLDINVVVVLALAGCLAVPLGVKLTKIASERTFRIVLGAFITLLGALVLVEAIMLGY